MRFYGGRSHTYDRDRLRLDVRMLHYFQENLTYVAPR